MSMTTDAVAPERLQLLTMLLAPAYLPISVEAVARSASSEWTGELPLRLQPAAKARQIGIGDVVRGRLSQHA